MIKIVFTVIALVAASPALAMSKSPSSLELEVRKIAKAYEDLGWFSGTVLLAQDGKVFYQEAFGYADREKGIKNSIKTKYNLGSIMKHFTAVLVLQQIEKGTINFDNKLESFDLGFPVATAEKISIRHLLSHSSGFPDIFVAAYREDPLAFETLDKKLALLRDAPLLFEPGSESRYSNYGYIVLGAILEKVTGKSFELLLEEQILAPLKLRDSVFAHDALIKNGSQRYTFSYDGSQKFVGVREHAGPDGGMETTAKDTLTFFTALFYTDKLLSRSGSVFGEMFFTDGKWFGSFGGGLGVSAAIELDLEKNIQVVVLSNSDNLVAELISNRIIAWIKTGNYDSVMLPAHIYTYNKYAAWGVDKFRLNFRDAYKTDGYRLFIGRALNDLGMALLREKNWKEAFDIMETLVIYFPTAPQAYDSLAFAYRNMGDETRARENFSKALALSANFQSDYVSDNYGVVLTN